MNESLSTFLHSHFNLGSESEVFKNFNRECLQKPFYSNPKGIMKPNPEYSDPTPSDIGYFKEVTGMSTGDMGRFLSVKRVKMNSYISQKSYAKGNKFPSALWCMLTEAAGLSEKLILKPRYIDVREEVLETTAVLPTKHELFLLCGLSGLSLEDIANKSDINFETLKHNVHRGGVVINENLEYVNPKNDHSKSVIHSAKCTLTLDEWRVFRNVLGIKNTNYIRRVPTIAEAALSAEVKNPGYSDTQSISNTNIPINEIKQFFAESFEIEIGSKSRIYKDRVKPHFELTTVEYAPPTPFELRAMLFWTGYTFGELSMLMSVDRLTLSYLSNFRAASKIERDGETKVNYRFIKYAHWRRFLEAFNLVPQKQIRRLGILD